MHRLYLILTATLLAALLALNVRRARTQSFTTDEAFTYNRFVSPPVSEMLADYDANNHVLNTILMRVSAALFGVSEFTLRIPSLLCGLLYLGGVFTLCRYLFGTSWLFVLAAALLALNPLLVDYLSAARGYGPALAFLVWALYFLARHLEERRTWQLYLGAVALALSVASNLAFVFAGAPLAGLFSAILLVDGRWRGERWVIADHFLVPGIAVVFVLVVVPLSHATPGSFYVGTRSLAEAVDSLVVPALFHQPSPAAPSTVQVWLRIIGLAFVPGLVLAGLAVLAWLAVRLGRARSAENLDRAERFLLLTAGATAGALLLLVAGHHLLGLPYPERRTGLYFVLLLGLTGSVMLKMLWERGGIGRLAAAPGLAVALAATLQFASQWDVQSYDEWQADAPMKIIMGMVRERRPEAAGRALRIGASFQVEPTVNFYRQLYRLDWIEPVARAPVVSRCDYYILAEEDAARAGQLSLEVLYRDPLSGTLLARGKR